jgi:glucose-6-phosphate dehydrogenase assembly protein OpcA
VEEAVSGPVLTRTPPCRIEWQKIPQGMRSLWKACLHDVDGGDVARSLAINFLGVARADDAKELREAIERLPRRTPCRAFVLLLDDAAKPGSAELTATTRSHGSVRDIVLEEIEIRLPAAAEAGLPGLVRPLLMNDLPNHLYWSAPWPRDDKLFDALAAMCDHVIVDSRRFVDVAAELRAVNKRRATGLRITDLSWMRLRPFRRALAEAFERVPWTAGTPTSGRVRHGKSAGSAAFLLGEWLRERLGAKVEFDGHGDATAPCPDGVLLRAGDFEVELVAHPPQLRVHVTTPQHCYLPFAIPMSRGADGDLLGAAIDG